MDPFSDPPAGQLPPDEPPIDHDAERTLDRRKMVIQTISEEGGISTALEFMHDGANDPIYAAVAARYAPRMRQKISAEERRTLSMQMMREIAAEKSAAVKASAAPPEPEPMVITPATPSPASKRVAVTFEFGPLGNHKATYDDAVVADNVVILATRVGSAAGHYVPPAGALVVIGIAGYPQPLPVMLVGSVPFNGFDQVVMLVATDDD